jgi:hypothetical protein
MERPRRLWALKCLLLAREEILDPDQPFVDENDDVVKVATAYGASSKSSLTESEVRTVLALTVAEAIQ